MHLSVMCFDAYLVRLGEGGGYLHASHVAVAAVVVVAPAIIMRTLPFWIQVLVECLRAVSNTYGCETESIGGIRSRFASWRLRLASNRVERTRAKPSYIG